MIEDRFESEQGGAASDAAPDAAIIVPDIPEPTFVSYAQNSEDVVLWRALRQVPNGSYIDVGAADPTEYSVSRAFYEHGWRGIEIEPVDQFFLALRRDRPGNVIIDCAVGAEAGELEFFEVSGTGLSTLDATNAASALEKGFDVTQRRVMVRTLDDILSEHCSPESEIHFLKIDVEGAEAAVLRGIDLAKWRPWVVVIEATMPLSTKSTRDAFEGILTNAGYQAAMFDGLNVFYVSAEHLDLLPALSYPACPLDDFIRISAKTATEDASAANAAAAAANAAALSAEAAAAAWRDRWAAASADTVEAESRARRQAKQLRGELRLMRRNKETADEALRRLQRTPMRRVKGAGRAALNRITAQQPAIRNQPETSSDADLSGDRPQTSTQTPSQTVIDPVEVSEARLRTVLAANDVPVSAGARLPELLAASVDLLERSTDPNPVIWLLHVAMASRFPTVDEFQRLEASLALNGAATIIDDLRRIGMTEEPTWATTAPMRILTGPVIDASHTAYHNLHTGIQRVVREVVPRWLAEHEATLVAFDDRVPVYRSPTPMQQSRVVDWMGPLVGPPEAPPSEILVPWQTTVVVPELAADNWRTRRLAAIAAASVAEVSVTLYDLIPLAMPSACSEGMRQAFGEFMAVVRRASRVSTISRTVAVDMTGFAVAFENQAIAGPEIAAQPLPISAHTVAPASAARLESEVLGVPGLPLVLSVSSIEPRKNQLSILLAAEKLWSQGHQFQLLFIAGSGWERDNFDSALALLQQRGRPVRVVSKASEEFLWAAYQLARFSVFVSITEGFGLPAAESIAAGTPVVLSSHGSMREIGEAGGAEFVNAHDVADITEGMRRLLTDDERLNELQTQARSRQLPTWDEYATDTWNWLVEGKQPN